MKNQLNSQGFFKGLKVVELANILAGPSVGMFFAEMGAEVIKIENKTTNGDITRSWKLPNEPKDNNYSAYYCSINYHKKVLLLDLNKAADLEVVYEHIRSADIVITNFKSASADKIGIGFEQLQALNSTLIIGHLKGFPDGERPAFDVVLQAETGFLYMTGEKNRPPAKLPVALIDVLAAHQLKEALLIALLHQARTGKGSVVSVSLYEAAIASLVNQATNWLMANHIPQKMGTQHPNIAPYGDLLFTKDDKMIVLAVGTERHYQSLCKVFPLDALKNKVFSTNTLRVQNRDQLVEILAKAFLKENSETIMKRLLDAKIPAGLVRNMKEVFSEKSAQNMILEEVFEDGRMTKRVKTVVF